MTIKELTAEVLHGRILFAGEYRGSMAEICGYVDHKSGQKIQYVRATHLILPACGGNADRAIIYQRLPEIIETPEEAVFPYLRGHLYAFFLEKYEWKRGQMSGYMGNRPPELIDDAPGMESGGPVDAPSGAAIGAALP